MNSTNPEHAQLVISKLKNLLPVVRHILDESTVVARKYFEDRELRPDSYLFPHLVRFEAATRLRAAEYKKVGYEFTELSNNGLYIVYKYEACYYRIRVRKADEHGNLPTQNLSETLKKHYKNDDPFLPSIDTSLEEYVSPEKLKLVVVWDVDESHILTTVHLVCPKNEFGELYFAEEIEHAAMAVPGNPEFDNEAEEIEDIEIVPQRKSGSMS